MATVIDFSDDTALLVRTNHRDSLARLFLLRGDKEVLEMALDDLEAADFTLRSTRARPWDAAATARSRAAHLRVFYSAKVFVCAMRRFARLLEAIRARGCEYPPAIARTVCTAWKRERAFFETYRLARDAIEHIDGEVRGTNRRFFQLTNDHFEVVEGTRAYINRRALGVPIAIWNEILDAARTDLHDGPRVRLLRLLRVRAGALTTASRK